MSYQLTAKERWHGSRNSWVSPVWKGSQLTHRDGAGGAEMEIDSNRLPEGPLPRRLADRYMNIVRRHAYRLARRLPSHVNVEDLMGAGFVGLADALTTTLGRQPAATV